jgi:RNA polymerase sigma-70 factor (ECF subfamily)
METVLPLMRGMVSEELADFDTVVRVHQPAIFRFILASLRDVDAAETLTQECLIKAYQARQRFRGDASVKTWLMQIAVNSVRNHLANRRLMFWRRTQRSGVDAAQVADWLPDRHRSPESVAQAKQRVQAVWEAAALLSEKQRMVFLLRFVEDMDLLEIAAATGMKEGTVKVHLFRAVQSIRERIEECQ